MLIHRLGIRTKLRSLKKHLPVPALAISDPEGGLRPFPALLPGERRLLLRVSRKIDPSDSMTAFGHAHYFGVGLSAARSVKEAADAVGLVPRRVLDFPCGYGRVLRYLKALYPDAHFVASDLEREAVDFCARGLKAEGVYSSENLSEVRLGKPFDLIWVGSLLTHFDEAKMREAVSFFGDNLAAGGLLIFTTHGEGAARRMRSKTLDYGVGEEGAARLLALYADRGHGFEAYDHWPGYGISLTSPAWVRELMSGWREVYFGDHVWDNHHDVFGFVKS